MSDKAAVNPKSLRFNKHHGVPGLSFGVGLQSVFDRGANFIFQVVLGATDKMIFRGHSDHTTDKVYLPAEIISNEERNTGSFLFVPSIVSPQPKYHKIEFQRRDVWAVAGRRGEDKPFGLSKDGNPFLSLAFPSIDFPNKDGFDSFPDTYILIENKKAENGFLVIKLSSDFAKPQEFVVGEPVVVNWAIVPADEAPECLKKELEDKLDELKMNALADRQVSDFANRRGLTRK